MTSPPPFRMTVCGIEELPNHCEAGVTHVLSILDPSYPVPDAFGGFGEHTRLELRFHDVTEITDGAEAPRPEHVEQILALGRDLVTEAPTQAHLLVHCHAGVSRSTASMLMILAQAQPDLPAPALAERMLRIREKAWPNLRMLEFAERRLNRQGVLIDTALRLYRYQLTVRPHLRESMIHGGREREVKAAQQASG